MVAARERETGTVVLTDDDEQGDHSGTVLLEAIDAEQVETTTELATAGERSVRVPPSVTATPYAAATDISVAGKPGAVRAEPAASRPAGPIEDALGGQTTDPPTGPRARWRTTEDEQPPPPPLRPRWSEEEHEVDMTPMVDVTFLLLIFFMVTAAFAVQKSIEVPRPSEDQVSTNLLDQDPEDQGDFVTVQVDQFNTFHVLTADWEEEAPSEQDLHIMLRRSRASDSGGVIPTKLKVEAHGDSLHEKVVAALDAGTATGFEEVQLATLEDE